MKIRLPFPYRHCLSLGLTAFALTFLIGCKSSITTEEEKSDTTTYPNIDSATFDVGNKTEGFSPRLTIYQLGSKPVTLDSTHLPIKFAVQENLLFEVTTKAPAAPNADSLPYATGQSGDISSFGFAKAYVIPDSCSPTVEGDGANNFGIGVVDLRDNKVLHIWDVKGCAVTLSWNATHLHLMNGQDCYQKYYCGTPAPDVQ